MTKSTGTQDDKKNNKGHKTLRDKLRKKREELKKHKKEKSEHKKQYNSEDQKLKYFSQSEIRQGQHQHFKQEKVRKHIQKFINLYEDDLNDFYDLFGTFDEGGFIDISDLENKALQKCLKKMFKYLPLKREKKEYKKSANCSINLQRYMKNLVSNAIENYLENGTNKGSEDDNSSKEVRQQNENHKKIRVEKKGQKIQENDFKVKLYKEEGPVQAIGPSIPAEERQRIAQLFERQMKQFEENKQKIKELEDQEFDKIFSMSKTNKQLNVKPIKIDVIPDHLLAKGSAQIGQKVEQKAEQIEQYNRLFRPKKLIDMHKEMIKVQENPNKSKERRPFDRERDIVIGKSSQIMNNSVFFDFKGRMTKSQGTNQFL